MTSYQLTISRSQLFQLTAPHSVDNMCDDVTTAIIAISLWHSVFKNYDTLQQLMKGREVDLAWKPDFGQRPLFVLAGPRGMSMNYNEPMNDNMMCIMFTHTCQDIGIWGMFIPFCLIS